MNELQDYAKSFLGIPYVWGGANPFTGFDCSGYVQWLLASVGLDPKGDQTAQGLYEYFRQGSHGIPCEDPMVGCLVFYGRGRGSIKHVSFVLDKKWIIEAGGGGSDHKAGANKHVSTGAAVRKRLYSVRSDVVAILRPKYEQVGLR